MTQGLAKAWLTSLFLLTHPVWDVTTCSTFSPYWMISTHTSRVGCDICVWILANLKNKFLLTHPVWDVTCFGFFKRLFNEFLLTHPVWDVTIQSLRNRTLQYISTHTSRVGCDYCLHIRSGTGQKFLLTHPVWDVTKLRHLVTPPPLNFYSHIPCGMWLKYDADLVICDEFLLTHPVWDVTVKYSAISFALTFLLTHPVWDVTVLP